MDVIGADVQELLQTLTEKYHHCESRERPGNVEAVLEIMLNVQIEEKSDAPCMENEESINCAFF